METGIIGLPLAGKTTIYNALTGMSAQTSAGAGSKRQPNIAEIHVPDTRIDFLTGVFKPKKVVHATIVFKDMQLEFNPERGISPASIAEMRNTKALALVIRAFKSDAIPHPFEKIDPASDLNKLLDSLVFSDYEIAEKRIERLEKEAKKDTREYKVLQKISEKLLEGKLLGQNFLTEEEEKLFSGFAFLTAKPLIVIANTGDETPDLTALEQLTARYSLDFFPLRGDLEMEIAQLPPEDQKDFLADLGLEAPASNRFIRCIYNCLKLMSFLTVGEDEVRAWNIPVGCTAVKAAGKIHSDLEKGFIRAEVIAYADFVTAGSMAEVKKANKQRLEGKSYIVQDGDIMNIRFNK